MNWLFTSCVHLQRQRTAHLIQQMDGLADLSALSTRLLADPLIPPQLPEAIPVGPRNKPYTCDQCGVAYSHLGSLNRHKLMHSGERPYMCGSAPCL